MDKYWIDGPPERFERGMLVRLYWDWELVVILVQEDGAWVHPDEDHDVTFITLVDVTSHCPMMPVKEAKDIANELWKRWLADPQPRVPFDVAWSVEWREREAE